MAFEILGTPIKTVGIVGSGQIGPDIALHFTKVLQRGGGQVIVVDISKDALASGQAKFEKKIDRGVKTKAFKPEVAAAMKAAVSWTDDYERMRDVDLIVEAASEDRGLKRRIFAQLEGLCRKDTVFASNSSHLEPEEIFAELAHPGRSAVVHYFFPAERNPVVEVVPGRDSDPALADSMLAFYEAIGKVPIKVGSRYGYAVDPIFEGMFQAAALLVEAGMCTIKEADAVSCRALGYTVGPFTAMNLTGGNPITQHGLNNCGEKLMAWFGSPRILDEAMKSGEAWDTPKRGEAIEIEPEREQKLTDALHGAYLGLVGSILDSGITNVGDLEMALEISLDMKPPFQLMNELGVAHSLELVKAYVATQKGFPVPKCIEAQAASGKPWEIPTVLRKDVDGVAVITIRRPKVLNAMNNAAFTQLAAHFDAIRNDDSVGGAVITGFGAKAFVSGADVNFLATIETPEQGVKVSVDSNAFVSAIENCGKPVVCALNGFALGGGNEIAMACNARIARKGLRMLAGQPEPNLGIIAGAGGTQRLPRWIGVEKAAEILRSGRPISGAKAVELGLVHKEVAGDLVGEAVAMVKGAISGETPLPTIERGPIEVPASLPDVDIGHCSRAVDAIMVRAILEGCRKPLAEGIAFEAKMFGEVCKTKDMRIGVDNFIANGPGKPAPFVHA